MKVNNVNTVTLSCFIQCMLNKLNVGVFLLYFIRNTKTRLCDILQFFTAVKMKIFR